MNKRVHKLNWQHFWTAKVNGQLTLFSNSAEALSKADDPEKVKYYKQFSALDHIFTNAVNYELGGWKHNLRYFY